MLLIELMLVSGILNARFIKPLVANAIVLVIGVKSLKIKRAWALVYVGNHKFRHRRGK